MPGTLHEDFISILRKALIGYTLPISDFGDLTVKNIRNYATIVKTQELNAHKLNKMIDDAYFVMSNEDIIFFELVLKNHKIEEKINKYREMNINAVAIIVDKRESAWSKWSYNRMLRHINNKKNWIVINKAKSYDMNLCGKSILFDKIEDHPYYFSFVSNNEKYVVIKGDVLTLQKNERKSIFSNHKNCSFAHIPGYDMNSLLSQNLSNLVAKPL